MAVYIGAGELSIDETCLDELNCAYVCFILPRVVRDRVGRWGILECQSWPEDNSHHITSTRKPRDVDLRHE